MIIFQRAVRDVLILRSFLEFDLFSSNLITTQQILLFDL